MGQRSFCHMSHERVNTQPTFLLLTLLSTTPISHLTQTRTVVAPSYVVEILTALRKSITGIVNQGNVTNIKQIVPLFYIVTVDTLINNSHLTQTRTVVAPSYVVEILTALHKSITGIVNFVGGVCS